jgi:aminocarboxymuconate-semialdehyde decarboxylase
VKIDVHAHIIPDTLERVADGIRIPENGTQDFYLMPPFAGSAPDFDLPGLGQIGPAGSSGMIAPQGQGNSGDLTDLNKRLSDMDAQGVNMQVLSMPPFFFYRLEPQQALRVCQSVNNALAEIVGRRPDRFVAIADLPLQAPELAAQELERAVTQLDMRGLEMCTNILGKNLDDRALWPFWSTMQDLDVPAFLHPSNVLGQDRLVGYHLANLIGNPTDSAVAAATLIFGGVLKQFPRLKFYLAHAGGSCPYLRGRWEHGWRVRAEGKVNIQNPPSEYFGLLYFDTLAHSIPALNFLVESVGPERVMLGTDYPFDMGDADPVKTISSLPHLSLRDKDLIFGGNAIQLFKYQGVR